MFTTSHGTEYENFLINENKQYNILEEMLMQHEICRNWEDVTSHLYELY
jgi:hypothetical protein